VAILVTRPVPENETTAAALRARGFNVVLSPTLIFEQIGFHDDADAPYDGVIVTSANAVRAISTDTATARLRHLPVFAVGSRTADAARDAGFDNILNAKGDGQALIDTVSKAIKSKKLKKGGMLCYLAGADLARDLAGDLGELGLNVVTHTTYRMRPVSQLSDEAEQAFRAGQITAVLHYSRRSARAFVAGAQASGVEIAALALPQCCISDAVAIILHDAGATQVAVARTPDEDGVIEALARVAQPPSA
jgi:uroporphyrinogen-III synthase